MTTMMSRLKAEIDSHQLANAHTVYELAHEIKSFLRKKVKTLDNRKGHKWPATIILFVLLFPYSSNHFCPGVAPSYHIIFLGVRQHLIELFKP